MSKIMLAKMLTPSYITFQSEIIEPQHHVRFVRATFEYESVAICRQLRPRHGLHVLIVALF